MRENEILENRLAELGRRAHEQGVVPLRPELLSLADLATCYQVAPGAAVALIDPSSPHVVVERAIAVASLAILRAARDAVDQAAGRDGATADDDRLTGTAAAEPVPA